VCVSVSVRVSGRWAFVVREREEEIEWKSRDIEIALESLSAETDRELSPAAAGAELARTVSHLSTYQSIHLSNNIIAS